ncbi:MAG: hypothetical protein COB53_05605 [Elusimicrobia bacterium]|nr:MAG: hypothetical protein COB53_05605 [Elusimicrobiota bacterium]
MKKTALLILGSVLFAGCLSPTVISEGYDRSKIKRVAVLQFGGKELGAGDLFAKHLIRRGFRVVERSRVESIFKEQRLGLTGAVSAETAKKIGNILGVDGLVMGQVSHYAQNYKEVVITRSKRTDITPVYRTVTEKHEDGSIHEMSVKVGTSTHHTDEEIPVIMSFDAEVGIIAKIVDVETGEIVWIGSTSSEGSTPLQAVESAVSYLVKKLKKEW